MSEDNLNLTEMYIVLVEGSDTQVHIILNQFEALQITNVEVVSNGQLAIEKLKQDVPDLLISSMYLKDMTAIELMHQIREDEHLRDIPFLLMSSETSLNVLDPLKQADVVDILKKPFDVEQLKISLDRAVDYINVSDNTGHFSGIEMEYVKVLIIDDSHMARKHTRRFIRSVGIEEIDEAADGEDAIALIEDNYYDLIIVDYYMPGKDGTAVTQYVRAHESHNGIPILMITSETDQVKLDIARSAGVNAICSKPYENEELLTYIKELLIDV